MIGSLMSRLGAAEKLSIPQLQQAIQNGTIPAFVGVPLLQQKVQETKQAQMAMAGQAGPQPSIAQQVMGEAQGIEAAQSNLPPEGFAPGGIIGYGADDADDGYAGGGMVAFDDGGDVEEDDDSSEDIDFGGMNKEEERIFNSLRASYMQPSEYEGIAGLRQESPTGTGIRADAKAPRGIDSLTFVEKVKNLESGGRHYDKEGNILTSSKGAEGIMQVMPHTQRDPGFGVTPARDRSPKELERVGIDYANALLRKYGDEKLAAMAYNWGPGNVDKWLAGGMKGEVPKETRQYAANFAEGGIAHFAKGDYVGFGEEAPYDPNEPSIFSTIGSMLGSPLERIKNQTYGKGFITEAQAKELAKAKEESKEQAGPPRSAMMPEEQPTPAAPAAEPVKTEVAPIEDPYKEYINQLAASVKSREERLAKDRETDKYMALLSAGLGMMGGTSPFAAANIGQGAQQGIQAAMANRKAQIAEENAIASSRLGLTRADLYRGMHLEDIKQKALARGDRQAYLQADLAIKQQKADIAARLAPLQVQKGNIALEKSFGDSGAKAEIEGQLKEEFGKNWKKDTKAQAEFKRRRAAWIRDNIGGSEGSANSFESLMQE